MKAVGIAIVASVLILLMGVWSCTPPSACQKWRTDRTVSGTTSECVRYR